MKDHLAYARYVLRHKWNVLRASRITGASLWRCIVHDASKFLPSEWVPYVKAFYAPDGSSRYEPTVEFDQAWRAHQKRNKHHWQHWVLLEDEGATKALPMPEAYVREMVADWIGAGEMHRPRGARHPDTSGWYAANKDKMVVHETTRRQVERMVKWVAMLERMADFTAADIYDREKTDFYDRRHLFRGDDEEDR